MITFFQVLSFGEDLGEAQKKQSPRATAFLSTKLN